MSHTMEARTDLSQALRKWQAVLGDENVLLAETAVGECVQSETGSSRRIPVSLSPRSVDEITQVVRIANEHAVPLYPMSTGRNWGYGASMPVVDHCAVLDLSKMNRILEMEEDLGLVSVQPGVTHSQLYEYLRQRNLKYIVPVSGGGPNTSLVGNALERGYGITPYSDHFGAVTSLQAVLPDGSVYQSALTALGAPSIDKAFKWGVGPYLDGLFTQSGFGIVTEMTIALAPLPERVEAFMFKVKTEGCLEETVSAIRDTLAAVGGVAGSFNLMNAHRMLAVFDEYPRAEESNEGIIPPDRMRSLAKEKGIAPWTVAGVFYGDKRLVQAAKDRTRRNFGAIDGNLIFLSRAKINFLKRIARHIPKRFLRSVVHQLDGLDESFGAAEGVPTEIALNVCYWKRCVLPPDGQMKDPAKDGCGLIWYSPLVPMKPDQVREYVDMVYRVCLLHQIEPLITLTSLSSRCFDSTVPILFDRGSASETERAQDCYRALFEEGIRRGFVPYRVGVDHMGLIVKPSSVYWTLVGELKKALDPNGIVAPGRYSPIQVGRAHKTPEIRTDEAGTAERQCEKKEDLHVS